MAPTVDPNTPQSNTSAQPPAYVQKNQPGASLGLTGEGNPIAPTADAFGQQWVAIASNPAAAAQSSTQVNYQLAMLKEQRTTNKLLALILQNEGGELPSELDAIYEDDQVA